MSYSNPVIKEIIRERLTDMVLKRLQEASNLMSPADALKASQSASGGGAAGSAAGSAAGGASRSAARIAAGNVARGIRTTAETFGASASGAKLMKLGKFGPGLGAVLQGADSASTEWNENKEKGLGDTENVIKSGIRGVAGGVGAGVGVWGGAGVGAAVGAGIGSVVPIVGTAIGGVVGGIFGGIAGGMGGGWVGDKVGDAITNIGEDPIAQRKFKQDTKNAENDERQKRADDRWSSKFGSSSDNGFGDAPRPGGNGQRSSGGSYRGGGGRGGRGQSQNFSIGGAGSVDFSASQTQWDNDNSNYNGDDGYDGGGQGGKGGGGGQGGRGGQGGAGVDEDSLGLNKPSASSKSSNGVTRYNTDIDFSAPVTVDSFGPAKKDLVAAAGAGTAMGAGVAKGDGEKTMSGADALGTAIYGDKDSIERDASIKADKFRGEVESSGRGQSMRDADAEGARFTAAFDAGHQAGGGSEEDLDAIRKGTSSGNKPRGSRAGPNGGNSSARSTTPTPPVKKSVPSGSGGAGVDED